MAIFHSYVSLPEGIHVFFQLCITIVYFSGDIFSIAMEAMAHVQILVHLIYLFNMVVFHFSIAVLLN